MFEKNYYQIFGLRQNASYAEIKKAYRRLAFKYHPDANKGDKSCENVFKKITFIYSVLSNPVSRANYDAELIRGRNAEPTNDYGAPVYPSKPSSLFSQSMVWFILIIASHVTSYFFTPSKNSDNYESRMAEYVSTHVTTPQFVFNDTIVFREGLKNDGK